jgi:hypothetical protein
MKTGQIDVLDKSFPPPLPKDGCGPSSVIEIVKMKYNPIDIKM